MRDLSSYLGTFFFGFAITACSTMPEWMAHIAGVTPDSQNPELQSQLQRRTAVEDPRLNSYLAQAQARWPWAQGSQLRRRAQILARGPSAEDLARLDAEAHPKIELEILSRSQDLRISALPELYR